MSSNLFGKIINALKPDDETEEPSYPYESPFSEVQLFDILYTEPQDRIEYSQASEEPSPDFQEAVNPAHPYQYNN